jgi:uncharacterized protein YndB with AHSA1/START domain
MGNRAAYKYDFTFLARPELLYSYLSLPYNLALWFADKVDSRGDYFQFSWKDSTEKAKVIKQIPKKKIIFKWVERESEEQMVFEIDTDEITGATILSVMDFDFDTELGNAKMWWEYAIERLKRQIGG